MSADMHKYMACRAQTAYFRNAEKDSCLRDINHVRLLRQNRVLLDLSVFLLLLLFLTKERVKIGINFSSRYITATKQPNVPLYTPFKFV